MFEKTLTDIVKGIRASKRDTALYISQCIAEIKTEINSSDMYVKANALQKLTFLQMMGFGMSWASFATIEVMSSPRFAHKRIGYLAASQGFTQDTEVILLTTNLLKKELRGALGGGMNGVYEAGLAVNCISNIVTEDLSQDLLPELTNLTQHPQPYLRKKAILCLFKVFIKYPQGLRLTFAQIQQCLGDSDSSVVSCAVNVITELSDTNPKNYLHLAPAFFDLLTTSSNNWMLIKVVKLLGSLVPEEPRLARKLLEPLAAIVRNTPAKSLLYEAVHAITLCLPYCRKSDGSMPPIVPEIVTLCAKTLRDFVEERDQNLKYLGLVGFSSLMISHPKVLTATDYRPLILACLSDEDVTIRSRALGLLTGMASRKNLMELVSQLMQHVELASGSYKLDLVAKIVEMCSGEKYALLQNFSWYLDILFQLGHMRGLDTHADLLRYQVTDVALRVLPVRAYAVRRSIEILLEGEQDADQSAADIDGDNGRGKHIMSDILPAAAWIIGEYSDLMPDAVSNSNAVYIYNDSSEGPYHSIVQAVTAPSNSTKLPTSTQKVYIQAGMKVFAAASANMQVSDAELEACVKTLVSNLTVYMQSTDVEVQERALTLHVLLESLKLTANVFTDGLPGLTPVEDDDSADKAADGNLLGIPDTGLSAPKATKSKKPTQNGSSGGLASRCRKASETLNFTLKPSPMKPTSAKAQRKKHSAPNGVDVDMEAPVDLSVFSSLIDDETAQRAGGKLSMEAVSFTQQRPLRIHEHVSVDAISSMDFSASNAGGGGGAEMGGMMGSGSTFQNYNNSDPIPERTNMNSRPQTAGDPFYLNSGPSVLDTEEGPNAASRFGAIELGDGDSEDEPDVFKKKKKGKKKIKQKAADFDPIMGTHTDLSAGMEAVTIYDSDDGDEDDLRLQPSARRGAGGKAKKVSSLAKVDLTMPLREDEIMLERKHRVVPDRSFDQPQHAPSPSQERKKKKESKKSKKASKKSSKQAASAGGTGDLLDLGSFSAVPEPSSAPAMDISVPAPAPPPAGVMSSQTNAINSAFDDLLGFSQSSPAPQLAHAPAKIQGFDTIGAASPSGKSGKRPWLRATVKTSHTNGSPLVDWSKVSLFFRVYRSSNDASPSASIVIRVDNHMDSSLSGLTLRLKGHQDVGIGNVAPGASAESSKIGPFSYPQPESALDIKGSLVTSECSVSVKLSLPVSMHLMPQEGLALEDVAHQLASPGWSSHSAKIEISSGISPEKVKPLLSSFLRAAEVEPGSSGPVNGTFAAQSPQGSQIRVLVKVKPDAVKVDVKCTNPQLGKALVADLKRLFL
jgi:AP-3 complex subunit delta-1